MRSDDARRTRRASAGALTLLALGARALAAQPTAPAAHEPGAHEPGAHEPGARGSAPRRGAAWEVLPFVAYSHRSPTSHWGVTPFRSHYLLGVQLAREVARAGRWSLAWAPSVTPVFVLDNDPPAGVTVYFDRPGAPNFTGPLDGDRRPVWGVGAAPVAVRAALQAHPRVALQVGGAAGAVCFTRAVPVEGARRLNATFEAGAAVDVSVRPGLGVVAGLRYHHLSNAYTASYNPGVDGRLLHLAVRWSARTR